MATRLYLTASSSMSSVANTSHGVRLLSGTKAGTASSFTMTLPSYTGFAEWVTTPLSSSWTPTGSFTFCVGMSGGGDVDFFVYGVPGNAGGGSAGTVGYKSLSVDNTPGSAQGWMPPTGMDLSDATVVPAGYRLVFRISNYSGSNTVYYGGTGGTDLTSANTNVTTRPGWVQFADTISFAAESTASAAGPRGMLAIF